MGLDEILRCGELFCAVGLLIGTSFLGGGPSTDAGGRVSSLCFCTFADQRSQTPSPANTKLRDDQQSATQARSEIVAPLAPLAHTLSRRRCLPAASLRVRPAPPRRLLAPSAGTQPTHAARAPARTTTALEPPAATTPPTPTPTPTTTTPDCYRASGAITISASHIGSCPHGKGAHHVFVH